MTSECVVIVSEDGVRCERPGGLVESVTWEDLKAVVIETNDEGPFAMDVFWILIGERSGCVVPLGAKGENLLIERLQQLPDFDNMEMINAMSSTENQRFLCWKKEE